MSNKHPEHQESGVFSSNNNLGVFGFFYGIGSIFKGLFSNIIEDSKYDIHKVYDSVTDTYEYNGAHYDKNGKRVWISRSSLGPMSEIKVVDAYGRVIKNATQDIRDAKIDSINNILPCRITAKRLHNYKDESRANKIKGNVFKDIETGREYVSRTIAYEGQLGFIPRRWFMGFVDCETGELVRFSDVGRELEIRCKNQGLWYVSDEEFEDYKRKINAYVMLRKKQFPQNYLSIWNVTKPTGKHNEFLFRDSCADEEDEFVSEESIRRLVETRRIQHEWKNGN